MSSVESYLHLAAIVCYAFCAIRSRGTGLDRQGRWLGQAAILFQVLALYQLQPVFGFSAFHVGVAIAHYALFSMIAMAILDRHGRFPKSWMWLSILASVGSVLSILPFPERVIPAMTGLLWTHLVIATLAYSAFIVSLSQMSEAFLVGRSIARHEKKQGGGLALLDMEGIVFRNVTVGFVLLTLTIITGIAFYMQGDAVKGGYFTHKNLFAILTWILCAILIFGRWSKGWRGVVALRWYAASTGCLVLSYLGTIVVLDLILRR